jgi:hypothetical protein
VAYQTGKSILSKMEMGITLNEAIENSSKVLNEIEAEKNRIKQEVIKDACLKIDRLISQHIKEILKKPVRLRFDIFTFYEYMPEIQAMYVDFTILYHPHEMYINVKLSDKDWDWVGYGVKKEDVSGKNEKSFNLGLPMWWSKKLHV